MGFGRSDTDVVISTPLRTAIGTFGGSLKDVPATDLGATVGKAVLERSGIDPERVDQVIVGNILSAGQGMNPGRQVGVKSGVPVAAPGITLNRMCGSGLQAVVNAGQARDAIAAGARFVVSPGIDRDIIQTCLDAAIPVVPGVATPSEIMIALGMGIDVVKFFPAAALGGVATIRAFSAPFPGVRFVPTGGIDMASAPTYLAEQSVLAIGGSWMVSTTLLRSGNWAEVTALAAEASTLGGPR